MSLFVNKTRQNVRNWLGMDDDIHFNIIGISRNFFQILEVKTKPDFVSIRFDEKFIIESFSPSKSIIGSIKSHSGDKSKMNGINISKNRGIRFINSELFIENHLFFSQKSFSGTISFPTVQGNTIFLWGCHFSIKSWV